MEVLLFLIPLSFVLAGSGLAAFIWATRNGQFADMRSPAEKLVFEDYVPEATSALNGTDS